MQKTLDKIEDTILWTTLLLFPIFVLPLFPNLHLPAKTIFLVFLLGVVLVIRCIKTIIKGTISFSFGKFDFSLLLMAASFITSTVIKTPNKMEAFFVPGSVTIVLFGIIAYFLTIHLAGRRKYATAIFLSGIVVSVFSLLSFAKILDKAAFLPTFLRSAQFNPVGGYLPAATFLLMVLPIGIVSLLREKDLTRRIFISVASLIIIFGVVVNGTFLIPGKNTSLQLPDLATSWSVAIDSIKTSPLFGVGPTNYVSAFTRFKPLEYNQTDLWAVRFTNANNFYFTLATELGLLGILALVLFIATFIKNYKESELSYALLILLALGLFLPFNPVLLFFLVFIPSLVTSTQRQEYHLGQNKLPSVIAVVPILAGIGFLFFYSSKLVLAESTYRQALAGLVSNDSQKTFQKLTQAVQMNPYVDRYHATRSQVAFALANNLASKKDLTDAEKQTVAQLIQLAIAESKATVTLNPQRASGWELLAKTYQAIIPFAKGSDQFALQTYAQAVALDPINPTLRIGFGGIYYAQGNFDSAIDAFKLAVVAKPDFANAHYNLAMAYREKKDWDRAINEMTTVLSLVEKDSPDYQLATKQLEELEKSSFANLPAGKAGATEGQEQGTQNLTPPQGSPAPVIKPPVELPTDANPPVAPEGVPTPAPETTSEQ